MAILGNHRTRKLMPHSLSRLLLQTGPFEAFHRILRSSDFPSVNPFGPESAYAFRSPFS